MMALFLRSVAMKQGNFRITNVGGSVVTSSLLASELFTTSAIWEAPMGPNFIIIYLVEYQWVMLDRHGV